MRYKGFAAILPVIIIVILIVLGVGSFMYTNPGFNLYSLYNIGSPNVTPAPVQVMVDKSDFAKGHILVTFQAGTPYGSARAIFNKYGIITYENLTWKAAGVDSPSDTALDVTDVFKVSVEEGKENEVVTFLKSELAVKSATLDYSGNN